VEAAEAAEADEDLAAEGDNEDNSDELEEDDNEAAEFDFEGDFSSLELSSTNTKRDRGARSSSGS